MYQVQSKMQTWYTTTCGHAVVLLLVFWNYNARYGMQQRSASDGRACFVWGVEHWDAFYKGFKWYCMALFRRKQKKKIEIEELANLRFWSRLKKSATKTVHSISRFSYRLQSWRPIFSGQFNPNIHHCCVGYFDRAYYGFCVTCDGQPEELPGHHCWGTPQ